MFNFNILYPSYAYTNKYACVGLWECACMLWHCVCKHTLLSILCRCVYLCQILWVEYHFQKNNSLFLSSLFNWNRTECLSSIRKCVDMPWFLSLREVLRPTQWCHCGNPITWELGAQLTLKYFVVAPALSTALHSSPPPTTLSNGVHENQSDPNCADSSSHPIHCDLLNREGARMAKKMLGKKEG